MITQKKLSGQKQSKAFIILTATGTILNLIALLTEGNGGLVAVGCSLIALGIATNSKSKEE